MSFLRFSKLLNLNSVFEKIPLRQIYPNDPPKNLDGDEDTYEGKLDIHSSRLAIVGQEKNGLLLLVRDGYYPIREERESKPARESTLSAFSSFMIHDKNPSKNMPSRSHKKRKTKTTFIDVYSMATRELETVYICQRCVDIVSASINQAKNILLFTTRREMEGGKKSIFIWQSFIVEIPTQKKLKFSAGSDTRSFAAQSVKFIGSAAARWNKRNFYILFIVEGILANIYVLGTNTVTLGKRKIESYRVQSIPQISTQIVKPGRLVWQQFNQRDGKLFVMECMFHEKTCMPQLTHSQSVISPASESPTAIKPHAHFAAEFTLRCWLLNANDEDKVFKQIWEIDLDFEDGINGYLSKKRNTSTPRRRSTPTFNLSPRTAAVTFDRSKPVTTAMDILDNKRRQRNAAPFLRGKSMPLDLSRSRFGRSPPLQKNSGRISPLEYVFENEEEEQHLRNADPALLSSSVASNSTMTSTGSTTTTTNATMELKRVAPTICGHGFDKRVSVPVRSDQLQIVQMNGNATCLVWKHASAKTVISSELTITIWVLHHRVRLELTVPMTGALSYDIVASLNVCFDCIGDLLMVYIPGHYLQFIDCGADHEPRLSLRFSGKDAPALPTLSGGRNDLQLYSYVVPFDTLTFHSQQQQQSSNLRGKAILDCREGVLYEYTFNRAAILTIFEKDPTHLHLYALHLAIVHMNDNELVDRILRQLCEPNPEQRLSTSLMKEYLIGLPYQAAKQSDMPAALLALLPITSIPTIKEEWTSKHNFVTHFVELDQINSTPLNAALFVTGMRRFSPAATTAPSPPTTENRNASPFGRGLLKMFGLGDSNLAPGVATAAASPSASPAKSKSLSPLSPSRSTHADKEWEFVVALRNYMAMCYPRDSSSNLLAWARAYGNSCLAKSLSLYQCLQEHTEVDFIRYTILERFFSVLQQLAFPYPRGFALEFVTLGYRFLPRNVFLQYVERGVFAVSETFVVDVILKKGENAGAAGEDDGDGEKEGLSTEAQIVAQMSIEERQFLFAMLSILERKHFITHLERGGDSVRYLIEHFLSRLPVTKPVVDESADIAEKELQLQKTNGSFFIPATIFHSNFCDQYPFQARAAERSASYDVTSEDSDDSRSSHAFRMRWPRKSTCHKVKYIQQYYLEYLKKEFGLI